MSWAVGTLRGGCVGAHSPAWTGLPGRMAWKHDLTDVRRERRLVSQRDRDWMCVYMLCLVCLTLTCPYKEGHMVTHSPVQPSVFACVFQVCAQRLKFYFFLVFFLFFENIHLLSALSTPTSHSHKHRPSHIQSQSQVEVQLMSPSCRRLRGLMAAGLTCENLHL